MKKLLLLAGLLLTLTTIAQNKPKKKAEKPPSQKEIDSMMKDLQQEMNGMDPEDKAKLDSMGVKLPDANSMQQLAAFAAANADMAMPDVLVPKRDAGRIAALPKTPLTKASLAAYLQSVDQQLRRKLPAAIVEKTNGLAAAIARKNSSAKALAEAAVGCWTFGKPAAALLLLSKACMADPNNSDQLNNYAAMLTMCGGEQLALPILEQLNTLYPNNSTILNNLAHAWFGLGELDKASQYIGQTLKLCAWHPQANLIKARIAESKGNQAEAVAALKQSVSRMYSNEKERKLHDLNYQLKSGDIVWVRPNKPDQLGLSHLVWPDFPKNVEESKKLKPVWDQFIEACDQRLAELKEEEAKLSSAFQEGFQQRASLDLRAGMSGATTSALFGALVPKAELKLRPYVDELQEREGREPVTATYAKLESAKQSAEATESDDLKQVYAKWDKKTGEGATADPAFCAEINAARSKFLGTYNSYAEQQYAAYANRARKRINAMVNYYMYTEFPEKFDLSVNLAKQEWLAVLRAAANVSGFRDKAEFCSSPSKPEPAPMKKLPDYEKVNCQYKSEMNLIFGTIKTECSVMKAELEIDFVKLGWETKMSDRDGAGFMDEFQRCTIEVSASKSREFGEGPLKLEAEVGVTGFLEIDRTGIADAGIKAVAEVKVNADVVDTKIETPAMSMNVGPKNPSVNFGGVEAKISINSGFTAERVGLLKGL